MLAKATKTGKVSGLRHEAAVQGLDRQKKVNFTKKSLHEFASRVTDLVVAGLALYRELADHADKRYTVFLNVPADERKAIEAVIAVIPPPPETPCMKSDDQAKARATKPLVVAKQIVVASEVDVWGTGAFSKDETDECKNSPIVLKRRSEAVELFDAGDLDLFAAIMADPGFERPKDSGSDAGSPGTLSWKTVSSSEDLEVSECAVMESFQKEAPVPEGAAPEPPAKSTPPSVARSLAADMEQIAAECNGSEVHARAIATQPANPKAQKKIVLKNLDYTSKLDLSDVKIGRKTGGKPKGGKAGGKPKADKPKEAAKRTSKDACEEADKPKAAAKRTSNDACEDAAPRTKQERPSQTSESVGVGAVVKSEDVSPQITDHCAAAAPSVTTLSTEASVVAPVEPVTTLSTEASVVAPVRKVWGKKNAWYRPSDDLLSQTRKCVVSRVHKRAYHYMFAQCIQSGRSGKEADKEAREFAGQEYDLDVPE